MGMRAWFPIAALGWAACVATPLGIGGDTYQGVNAATNTAIALGAAAAQSHGQPVCPATCKAGAACNPSTGVCEPLPCGGVCRDDEQCNELALVPYCMVVSTLDAERTRPPSPLGAPLEP
jgi:hypothetical protein